MAARARIPGPLVAAAVRECLRAPGLPIRDIRRAAAHPGDAAALPFRDRAVWHSKPEIDRCVAARLKLDAGRVAGPRRDDNELYRSVADEISRLRRGGIVQDWRAGSGLGVWRLAAPLPPGPPGALSTSMAEGGPFSGGAAPGPADPQAPLYCVFTGIIRSGRKDNTYKFALARALLEYCGTNRESGGSRLVVPYRYLAGRFAEYYWLLDRVFGLGQTLKRRRLPEAVRAVRLAPAGAAGARAPLRYYGLGRADRADVEGRILRRVFGHARKKTSMVVPRFQNVACGPGGAAGAGWRVAPNPVFYSHSDDEQEVRLEPAAFDFFRSHYHILMWVVLDGWAGFMNRANPQARIDEAIALAEAGAGIDVRAAAEPGMLMERRGSPAACLRCEERRRSGADPYGGPTRLDAWSRIFGHSMIPRAGACRGCGRPLVVRPPAPRCACPTRPRAGRPPRGADSA